MKKTKDIFSFLKNFFQKLGFIIVDVYDVHRQKNDAVAGVVKLENGRKIPFRNDTLFGRIGGKKVREVCDFHSQENGKLAGTVKLSDSGASEIPFKENILFEEIEGEKVVDAHQVFSLKNGKLVGVVEISGYEDNEFLFKDNVLIEKIGGKRIKEVELAIPLEPLENNMLAGFMYTKKGESFLFSGDSLIPRIAGEKIRYIYQLYSQPDGTLVGIADLDKREKVLFQGDVVLEKIGNKKILEVLEVFPRLDGTLCGLAVLEGDDNKCSLFSGDTILKEIAGEPIKEILYVGYSRKTNGIVGIFNSDDKVIGFENNNILWEIKIKSNSSDLELKHVHLQKNGKLAGVVMLDEERWLFRGENLLKKIDNKRIRGVARFHSQEDGTISTKVLIEGKWWKWISFLWGHSEIFYVSQHYDGHNEEEEAYEGEEEVEE
ncbi:MAG: hypothetical protein N2692_00275 [Patescibacteria group bacterium]|jgi:hypothetical protein|nr:hypothetical protein [Patescibacteria group bacterium]